MLPTPSPCSVVESITWPEFGATGSIEPFGRLLNQAVIHADPPAGKRSDPPDEEQHIISTLTDLFFDDCSPWDQRTP